jgi:hypothetical protein
MAYRKDRFVSDNDSTQAYVRTNASPLLTITSSPPLVRILLKKYNSLPRPLWLLSASATLPASTALPHHARPCSPRLACSLWPPPSIWRVTGRWASTTDALARRRGGELCVKSSRQRVACAMAARRALCTAVDLRTSIELHNDKPPSVQATRWHCVESSCCKRMF